MFDLPDTVSMVSIVQNSPIGMRVVMFTEAEVPELVKMLNAFAVETGTKQVEQKAITYRTTNLLLSCSYFKDGSWLILVQNADPKFQQSSDAVQQKTGYAMYHFVEIKPRQLDDVVKLFSKVLPPKAI